MLKRYGKITALLMTCIILLLTLFGCGGDVIVQEEVKRRESTGDKWTVMIYMCGSTLEEQEGRASDVLGSLAYDLPENIRVVVETGGSTQWKNEDIYEEYLQDYEVQKNGLRLVNQKPLASMGESDTLYDFYEWAMETYPADKYIGVIWDHGGGPLGGAAYDSAHGFDSLSVAEIKNALSRLSSSLDIIGFDASLMSNLETASALSLYADYMVASEDVMPMCGWNYAHLFETISYEPSLSAAEVGAVICDDVKNWTSGSELSLISMAVTDLSKVSALALAFDGMAEVMVNAADSVEGLWNISYSMNELESLGGNSPWEGYSNLIDLGELTSKMSEQIGTPAVNIANSIRAAVVYRAVSDYHNTSAGLSVYYPNRRETEELSSYRDICTSSRYMEFLEKVCIDTEIDERGHHFEEAGAWESYSSLAAENTLSAETDANGRYVLSSAHPELIVDAGVNFYMYSARHQGYVFLYRAINTSYDPVEGRYMYEPSGRLPRLNSTPVAMYLVSQNTSFDIYSIPVIYDGEMANIRVSRSKQADDYGEYTIFGIWKGVDDETGMAERFYKELENGDVVIPIYELYGGEAGSYVEGDRVRIGFTGAKITENLMDDGDYIVSYTAKDIYGMEYECGTNSLISTKGKVRIMNY